MTIIIQNFYRNYSKKYNQENDLENNTTLLGTNVTRLDFTINTAIRKKILS